MLCSVSSPCSTATTWPADTPWLSSQVRPDPASVNRSPGRRPPTVTIRGANVMQMPPELGPLWDMERRDALARELLGTMDMLPLITHEFKFADAPNGIVGLETALAVIVTNLVETGHLTFSDLVDRMVCTPARIFNLPGGSLKRGAVADVTVFDPKSRWTVDASQFVSKGRNSPYDGMPLVGRATCTIVAGSVVFRSGIPARGREKMNRTRG